MKKGSSAVYRSGRQERPQRTCQSRSHIYEDTHYVFLCQSDDSDEDDRGSIGLSAQRRKEEYLEKELEPGDTLLSLSIQFNCPIAELKRINHIHRDNEVFARRKIKVPIKYYSLLSEKLVGVHRPSSLNNKDGNNSRSSISDSSCIKPSQSSVVSDILKESHDSYVSENLSNDSVYNRNVLSTTDRSTPICDDDDETPLITEACDSRQNQNKEDVFQCNGSDWGLSWPQLLICTLLLGFAGPLVYIFYLKEVLEAKSGSHISNTTST